MNQTRRKPIWPLLVLLAVAVIVRLAVAPHPGHSGDEAANEGFCIGILTWGFDYYQKTDYAGSCYPPAMLYILGAAGALWTGVGGELIPGSLSFRMLVKALPILADLGILLLVYFAFLKHRTLRHQLLYGSLIALNPVMIFDGAIWGQFESLVLLPLIGAVVACQRNRPYLSLCLGALAVLIKLQAVVALPLLMIACYQKVKWRRSALALLAAIVLVVVLVAPFLVGKPMGMVVGKLLGQKSGENVSFTSLNAFNIWAFAGFFESQYQKLAGLTYLTWGLLLGGGAYLWACIVQWRRGGDDSLWISLTVAYLGMFVFMTMMHERYIYYPAMLATIWLIQDIRILWVWVILVAMGTLNMNYRLRIPNWDFLHQLHNNNITVYGGAVLNLIIWAVLTWIGSAEVVGREKTRASSP